MKDSWVNSQILGIIKKPSYFLILATVGVIVPFDCHIMIGLVAHLSLLIYWSSIYPILSEYQSGGCQN
jgi:hypothetical protein